MVSSVVTAAAALVAIHVGAEVPPDLAASAVRSCQIALGERQCVLYDPAASPAIKWQVTVTTPDDRADGAHIDLRENADTAVLVTRDLAFVPDDAPRERWASIGVLIAALVVARTRESEAETTASPAPEPSKVLLVPPRARPRSRPRRRPRTVTRTPAPGPWRLDLSALLSRRLERGTPELGGRFRASVLPRGGPWFGFLSAAAATRAATEPAVSWFSASVGPGVRAGGPASSLAAEFSVGGAAEYWTIGASEPGRSEHAGEFRWGGFVDVEALWTVHPRWIFLLGAEARAVAPRLRIDVSGQAVEHVPELGWLMFAGLRFIP